MFVIIELLPSMLFIGLLPPINHHFLRKTHMNTFFADCMSWTIILTYKYCPFGQLYYKKSLFFIKKKMKKSPFYRYFL